MERPRLSSTKQHRFKACHTFSSRDVLVKAPFRTKCAAVMCLIGRLLRAGTNYRRSAFLRGNIRSCAMSILKWALIFFVVSIVAGILGFTGVSAASADVA